MLFLLIFFCQRIIRCGGAVDDDMANIIVAQLLYLDAVDPKKVCTILFLLFASTDSLSLLHASCSDFWNCTALCNWLIG